MPSREEIYRKHFEENKTLRAIGKQDKRSREPGDVRRKDWRAPGSLEDDGFDELDVPDRERVMPRGERERRRANLQAVLLRDDDDPALLTQSGGIDHESVPARKEDSAQIQGTVVEVSIGLCRVDVGARTVLCGLRAALTAHTVGTTNLVAVGDEVLISGSGEDRGVVESVLPRRSALARPDVYRSHLQQVIAANVQQLLVVAAWREPAFWPELVDRYLITAERNRLRAILCVNKIDLAAGGRSEYEAALLTYRRLGYRVIAASAHTSEGVDELRQALIGASTVLAGLSGVGKSSLLAAVQPGLELRTSEVSERRHEGRHTTAQATLIRLDAGGFVVDTPGIREFGLSGLHRRDLSAFYPEITLIGQHCRYDDCVHTGEPGCAVRPSVRHGWISSMRYESYQKILAGLPD